MEHGEFIRKMVDYVTRKNDSQCCKSMLVGGIPTRLKNMSLSVGMIIPNIWKNKPCSKPPTSM